jgi:hypothetical protein
MLDRLLVFEYEDVGLSFVDFLLKYHWKLLRWPADRTKPGRIGGRFSSSAIEGPGLPGPWLTVGETGGEPALLSEDEGIVFQGPVFDRIRERVRGVTACPAFGAAVTIVPAMAIGGGRGLLGLKSGWMRSSIDDPSRFGTGRYWSREVGLEKLRGLEGGEDAAPRGGELG